MSWMLGAAAGGGVRRGVPDRPLVVGLATAGERVGVVHRRGEDGVSSTAPPRARADDSAENCSEWTHSSSWPSPSMSTTRTQRLARAAACLRPRRDFARSPRAGTADTARRRRRASRRRCTARDRSRDAPSGGSPRVTAERGERQHLLVHPVRLRILDEEVAPVRAANERAVGPASALLAECPAPAAPGAAPRRAAATSPPSRGTAVGRYASPPLGTCTSASANVRHAPRRASHQSPIVRRNSFEPAAAHTPRRACPASRRTSRRRRRARPAGGRRSRSSRR